MKNLLRAEEAAQLALAIVAIHLQPIALAWWMWPMLFLAPDLGMAGYLHSARAGALTYNLFHHKGVAVLLIALGWLMPAPWLALAGLILFAHSAFDRAMGYGLKHSDRFEHTHLGWIGKAKKNMAAAA